MPSMQSQFVRVLSILLGSIFIAAGIGKSFLLEPFVATVASIHFVPQAIARASSLVVIAIEILGGTALVAGIGRRIVPFAFLLLMGIFIGVLASAIIQGREFACNCFGTFSVALSNRYELALDMILFDAFAFLAYAAPSNPRAERKTGALLKEIVIAGVVVTLQVILWLHV